MNMDSLNSRLESHCLPTTEALAYRMSLSVFFPPWTLKVCVNLFFRQRFTDTNLRSRALFWVNSRAKRCVHGHFFWLFTGTFWWFTGTFWLFTGTFLVHGHLFFCSRALFLCSRAHFWNLFTGSCEMFTGIFLILFTGTFSRFTGKKKHCDKRLYPGRKITKLVRSWSIWFY